MEALKDRLRVAHRRAALIAISMMGSVFVYVIVAELLANLSTPWKGVVFTPDQGAYKYIRYFLLVVGIVGVWLVVKISSAVNLSPGKLANPEPALTTHAVIVSAACDTVGMFGLVLFLMAGNITDVYIFAGISLGLSLVFFPRYSRWEELAELWLASPTLECDRPRQRQSVNPKRWKLCIILVSVFIFMLGADALYRDNALEESYSLLLWAAFFPLTVIALLYFFFVVHARPGQEGIVSRHYRSMRPSIRQLAYVFIALLFGFFLSFSVRSALIASMDRLNETPIQIESVISGVSVSKECQVKVYLAYKWSFCLRYRGHRPIQTPWPLEKMTTDEVYKLTGQRIVLVGRKSLAGTVIDEIRLPPNRSIKPTTSGGTDDMR